MAGVRRISLTAKAALAMLPIITILIIMLGLRWSAARGMGDINENDRYVYDEPGHRQEFEC